MKRKRIHIKYPKVAASAIAIGLIFSGLLLYFNTPQPLRPNVDAYRDILDQLTIEGYSFHFPNETFSGKTAILIHDVDYSFKGAKVLAEIERDYDVRSVFYLRPDADYFTASISTFQLLESEGWKIGLHYDCLSRADNDTTLALAIFKAQTAYIRSFFNVTETSYHGDAQYRVDIINLQLYVENKDVWNELGLFEVYSYQNFSYIRDTDNILVIPETLSNLVLVQLHADWY